MSALVMMVEDAFQRIRAFAASADDTGRRALMASLHSLAHSFERPDETIHRIGCATLETAAAETGFNLGLFKHMVEAKGPVVVADVAKQLGAEVSLLQRILRYLAATGAVHETGPGLFATNTVTETLASELGVAGIRHYLYNANPAYRALPAHLKKTGYRNPEDDLHAAFQDAFGIDEHVYAWFASHPDNLKYFNDFMALRRNSDLSWLSVYPVREATAGWDADKAVYINIGGSIGHQCAEFKAAYPDVPGRVILQELPHSIAQALQTPGVENMMHNFWDPQPVKGAKFYYMRSVLHNHPDHKVLKLLELTKAAMTRDSILLIDEMILPETGVYADTAILDLTMMGAFASAERTEAQWRALVEKAGLRLVQTYVYNQGDYESVMDVRLP